MFSSLFNWRSSPSVPQDDFKKLHATLRTPPALPASPTTSSDCTLVTQAHIIDPYHLIVCQHGVLGRSADFDNVITELFVHHEVSVLEAAELAKAAVAKEQAAAATLLSSHLPSGSLKSSEHLRGPLYSCTTEATMGEREGDSTMLYSTDLSVQVPHTSTPTVTYSVTSAASPTVACAAAVAHSNMSTLHQPQLSSASSYAPTKQAVSPPHPPTESSEATKLNADPLRPDTALTQVQRTRRNNYKKTFHLAIEYPNSTNGRLYRSGNLCAFSPGSNNYLRSDAGTLACARKMLAEIVPQLHAWLDDVEARERERRAQWSVYARTVNTPEAARLAAEAAKPLPVCLSFMAHSFGGIIERECLYLLLLDTTETKARCTVLYDSIALLRRRLRANNVTFENFLSIVTPHCGAGECLWWPIYFGAWCLARLHLCQTYDELILSDGERVLQTRLLDAPHLKALGLFRRRVLFANTHRDLLVGFGTCSLIFENVETDHTKFVGVSADQTHCAAAFADETIEISRPIVLQSFEEEEEEAQNGGSVSRQGFPVVQYASETTSRKKRTFTLQDLDGTSPFAFDTAVDRLADQPDSEAVEGNNEAEDVEQNVYDFDAASGSFGCSDAASSKARSGDAFSNTLRPQPTFSWMPDLTATPVSMVSATSASTLTTPQKSVFTASYTIGRNVPSHVIPEMTLEEVLGPRGWRYERETEEEDDEDNDEDNDNNKNSNSNNRSIRPLKVGMLAVVMDPTNTSYTDVDAACGSPMSASVSPMSLQTRSLSVVRDYPGCDGHARLARFSCGSPTFGSLCSAVYCGGSDSDSAASSSRRSRGSRVTSVLRDPRWAAEHVRHAASAVHTEVKRRLSTAVSDGVPASENGVTIPTLLTTTTSASPTFTTTTTPSLLPDKDMPQYRQTPRAIAARLREKLSWRVRAMRFNNPIPVGHVACLGNWAFCGTSPLLVQSVAEELLIVLD